MLQFSILESKWKRSINIFNKLYFLIDNAKKGQIVQGILKNATESLIFW